MELRPLVIAGGAISLALSLPLLVAFALAGRPDVVRGLLLGLAVGLLNNLLLARKLDRVIDGREPWQRLRKTMPRNMMLRFGLVAACAAAAAQARGINLAGMAGGVGLCLVVGIIYASWTVRERWRKEDGTPVYLWVRQ